MKYIFGLAWLIMIPQGLFAQKVFSDVGTAALLTTNGVLIKNRMNTSNRLLEEFSKTQLFVTAQLEEIQDKHNLVLKGLQEVSGILNDAITVKNIFNVMKDINTHIEGISSFAIANPQYLPFTSKSMPMARKRMGHIANDVSALLSAHQDFLMNSGKRKEFLNDIHFDLMMLRASLYGMLFSMETAKRIGFWRALNPFQKYIDQDRMIMQDIIRKAGYLKR